VAKKSFKDLANLSKDELSTKVRESEAAMFQTRMKHKTGQLKDTAEMWRMRKGLAQMKTRLTQVASQASAKASGGKR
jgi:ribosomal protein L29